MKSFRWGAVCKLQAASLPAERAAAPCIDSARVVCTPTPRIHPQAVVLEELASHGGDGCAHCTISIPTPSFYPQAVVLEELASLKATVAAERDERITEDDEVRAGGNYRCYITGDDCAWRLQVWRAQPCCQPGVLVCAWRSMAAGWLGGRAGGEIEVVARSLTQRNPHPLRSSWRSMTTPRRCRTACASSPTRDAAAPAARARRACSAAV